MADLPDWMYGATDPLYRLRYGVTAAEKSGLAVNRQIPGAGAAVSPEDFEREERRASGYLFGQKWPNIAVPATSAVNALRFWEDPELHEIALEAARRGSQSATATAADQARGLQAAYTPGRDQSYGYTGGW